MASLVNLEILVAFERALDGVAVVAAVEPDDAGVGVLLRKRSDVHRLRVIWAGAGWPADVDRAIRGVDETWPEDLVVVARHLSSGSRKLLDERGASWVDVTGSAHLVAPGLLVVREVEPEAGSDAGAFSWSPSALSLAEALLNSKSPSDVRTAEIARLTGWSTPQVSQVLGAFDAEGWTAKSGTQRGPGATRQIIDPSRLLDAWTDAITSRAAERRFAERIFNDPMQFLTDQLAPALDEHDIRWAVTGWAAAEQLAPFATTIPTLQVYVEDLAFRGPLTMLMEDVPIREVQSGGRIEFRSAGERLLVLADQHDGIRLASTPRVYADLLALGGRGQDAAQHLREEVIMRNLRPLARRVTSADMNAWDKACRIRLKKRIEKELDDAPTVYDSGAWSVSYWLPDATLQFRELQDALALVEGDESGWPVWWVPTRDGFRPELRNGALECWFRDDATRNYGHSDFWRATPDLKLFLLRGYQEDGITGNPGTTLDPVLPVWRTAEALLHAARMARYVNTEKIEFLAHWEGLGGREIKAFTSDRWDFAPGQIAHDDDRAVFVHLTPKEIAQDLPSVVRSIVRDLFEVFDLFDPPGSLYATEITAMLNRKKSGVHG
jgi:hypothetical protein